MIDKKTGEHVKVQIHEEYGPYIRVSTYEDAGALEDLFDEKYYVVYWKGSPEELRADGGNEYFFGGVADPVKIQAILDEIEFD